MPCRTFGPVQATTKTPLGPSRSLSPRAVSSKATEAGRVITENTDTTEKTARYFVCINPAKQKCK